MPNTIRLDHPTAVGDSPLHRHRPPLENGFDAQAYTRGLAFRIVLFAFIGVGWDVLMTLLQQIVSGSLDRNALCPASAWMYFIYGGIPLIFYPAVHTLKRLRFPYPARLAVLLVIFYAVEFSYGSLLRTLGIAAWDYDWFLQPAWTYRGLITWQNTQVGLLEPELVFSTLNRSLT